MVAAVVVLKLAKAGLLDMDAPMADYLPDETLAGIANADKDTIRDAFAMRTGIPNFTDLENEDGIELFDLIAFENPNTVIGTGVALNLVRGLPGNFATGAQYEYSNTNCALLAEVIESVTGESLVRAGSSVTKRQSVICFRTHPARPFGGWMRWSQVFWYWRGR